MNPEQPPQPAGTALDPLPAAVAAKPAPAVPPAPAALDGIAPPAPDEVAANVAAANEHQAAAVPAPAPSTLGTPFAATGAAVSPYASASPAAQQPPSSQPGHPAQAGVQTTQQLGRIPQADELSLSDLGRLEAEAKANIVQPALDGLREGAQAIRSGLDSLIDRGVADAPKLSAAGVQGVLTITSQIGGPYANIVRSLVGVSQTSGAISSLETSVSNELIQGLHFFRARLDAIDLG